ncbi:hypothetical protein JXA02_09815 [candidate division KSB1 bacterium]|nr:hypothetical protein [candidate division KSB1 bacterium]RQW04032.1 MAG: hypothetical protein EH222_11665 [candidate division KSB1 bacterium]
MKKNTPTFNKLVAHLRAYHRKEKALETLQGVLTLISIAIPVLFLAALASALLPPAREWRIGTLVLALLILLPATLMYGGRALRALASLFKPNMVDVALRVGALYENVDDRLVNALQLYENYERDKERYSLDLIEAALVKMDRLIGAERFSAKVDLTKIKSAGRRLLLLAAVALIPGLLFNSFFSDGLFRLFHPLRDFAQVNIEFVVDPGDTTVIKGEDVRVQAWPSDTSAASLTLHFENQSGLQQLTLHRSIDRSFSYTFAAVRDTLHYSFSLRDARSRLFSISPIERPLLRSLHVRVDPPAYAKLEPYFLDENIGDIYALRGARIALTGTANKELQSGYLLFSADVKKDLDIQGRRISAAFTVTQNDTYSIHLVDEGGRTSSAAITYQIKVIPDDHPFVQIVTPGQDSDLAEDMMIPLAIEAQDDYGIDELTLAHQIITGGAGELDSSRFTLSPIRGFDAGEKELRLAFNWDVSSADMFPTDVLAYYVQVSDNDDISGPKSSRTPIYRARFPSLYEMYEQVASEQDDVTDAFEETLEKSRELQQKFDQLALEMQRTPDMDWQQKQEIEEAVEQQKGIEETIQDLTEKMETMVEKMARNDLFTPETIDKFQEIQELYQEIMTPELAEAMDKVSEALENMNEEMIRRAMEEMKMNAQDYNQALDRTISLLKKLKAEQQLDQAFKMAQDLATRQSAITEAAQRQPEPQRLQMEQERINKDAGALSDLLSELQRESKDIPAMPNEQIDDAATEMQSQNLQDNMNALSEMLEQGQMGGVPPTSIQVEQSFEKIAGHLDMAKQIMSGQMQQKALQAMRKGSRELLQLSMRQEEVMQQTKDLPLNSAEFPDEANRQQQIASGLGRVVDDIAQAMKENFGMPGQLSRTLGQAMTQMQDALVHMEGRDAAQASLSQGQAMAAVNSAVRQLQQSMRNMQQQGGGSGMSFQQFLQQMQQMGDAQSQINQQTQAMGAEGQLSLSQQAAMARLAAEQRQVRKSIEQLAREAGGLSEVLGSLDKIAEDMRAVEDDFVNQNITRDTINRQNRILSRMLDASKSLHQREFSRERQAETGKTYVTTSPDELPAALGERENNLEQMLLRAKKEGYSRDYLDMIEKYFKALTEYEISQD